MYTQEFDTWNDYTPFLQLQIGAGERKEIVYVHMHNYYIYLLYISW